MERVLGRFAPQFYALLRIVAGLLFACHGAQKLFGAFGGQQVPLAGQMGLAGVIEFVGGLMIAAGVFTGIVAFVASGEMAFAYFRAHAPRGTFPIQAACVKRCPREDSRVVRFAPGVRRTGGDRACRRRSRDPGRRYPQPCRRYPLGRRDG